MREDVRALVRVSAALGAGGAITAGSALAEALREALMHADAVAVEEVLLQSYLFAGYPRALQALQLWRELSGEPAPTRVTNDQAEWRARGGRTRISASNCSATRR